MKYYYILLALLLSCSSPQPTSQEKDISPSTTAPIRPYTQNPSYWQYKDSPLLLIGATSNDNLFQIKHLESHLDSLHKAGGNYIRNTMSDRDPGDMKAFLQLTDGKYDLNQWNPDYWDAFESLLQLTFDRDIIIQIEVWDRFDHSREPWLLDPFNPKNNINYTQEESRLDTIYPNHPGANEQPFFFSVPELDNNEVLLAWQQAFVDQMLFYSLQYPNVLYCIDNETKGREEWATYWAEYIRNKAGSKHVNITQMWDDWDVKTGMHKRTIDHPERYDFIDLSQNSHKTGHENWENPQFVFDYIRNDPRPVNSTKIYGNDVGKWAEQGKTSHMAVQNFFRNIIGGFASSRFHRPPGGLGLSEKSIHSLKTIREIEKYVKFWEIEPKMELLSDIEAGEAYVAAKEGEAYVVYFPEKGTIMLDLSQQNGSFIIRWLNPETAIWEHEDKIEGGKAIGLEAENEMGSFAIIVKDNA